MSITVVAHTKGGVSKSTTATNLAVMVAHEGKRPLLVDADTGQSSRTFSEARIDRAEQRERTTDEPKFRDDLPFLEVITLRGKDLHKQLAAKAADYDEIIVDVGGEGHGAQEIRGALLVAQRVITPCRPSRADTARLDVMNTLIGEARLINPELDALLFPVQASTNARANDVIEFYKDVVKFDQFRVIDTVIRSRDQYKGWAKTGEAIIEQKPRNKGVLAALDEMQQLYREIFNG